MPYEADGITYRYTVWGLSKLAANYTELMRAHAGTELIHAKADFDRAINHLGKAHWRGDGKDDIKTFGNLQKVIIAQVIGMSDIELWDRFQLGDIQSWRTLSYRKMATFLNTGH